MSTLGLGLLAGGGALGSLLGGIFGSSGAKKAARAQIQAAREAQQLYDARTGAGMGSVYRLLYGDQARDRARGMMSRDEFTRVFGQSAADAVNNAKGELASIDAVLAKYGAVPGQDAARATLAPGARRQAKADGVDLNDLLKRRKAATAVVQTDGITQGRGLFPAGDDAAAGPGMLSRMQDLFTQYDAEAKGLEGDVARNTQAMLGQGDAMLQETRGYGAERQALAQTDAERMLKTINAQTRARMDAAGLGGGTTEASQVAANTGNIFDALQRQRAAIGDQALQLSQGVRGQNLALQGQRTGALEALRMNNLQRSQELRQQPLQMEMSMLTGPAMNPYLNQDTTRYFPGVSPSGAAMSSLGNVFAGMGGRALGAGLTGLAAGGTPAAANAFGGGGGYDAGGINFGLGGFQLPNTPAGPLGRGR